MGSVKRLRRNFHFACPGWHRYTPDRRRAHEILFVAQSSSSRDCHSARADVRPTGAAVFRAFLQTLVHTFTVSSPEFLGKRSPAIPFPPSTPALRARSASSFFGGEPSPGRPTNIVNTRLRCPGGVRRDAPALASCRPRITHVRHGAHRRAFAVAHSACLSRPPERMWTDAAGPRPPPRRNPAHDPAQNRRDRHPR